MIVTKFITDLAVTTAKIAANAVTDAKIKLTNNGYLKARNAADSADINIAKVNASDRIEFASMPQNADVPAANADLTNKLYVDTAVAGAAGATNAVETFVLVAGDITNQFTDLAQVAKTGSINFRVLGGDNMLEGASYHYTVNYTGGAGGKTRISWVNSIATAGASALVATDVIQVQYEY